MNPASLFVRLVPSFARPLGLVACLGPLLASASVSAHDKWLEVEPFVQQAQGTTKAKVYLVTGEHFHNPELIPERKKARFAKFSAVSSTGKRDLAGDLREDQQPIAQLDGADLKEGTTVLALETTPIEIELPGAKFSSYLFEERLYDILQKRAAKNQDDATGRERYTRYLKAVVQVGNRLDKVAEKAVGHELEIIPQQHPYSLQPSQPQPQGAEAASKNALTVQVLFRGKPLAGRAITCANRYRGNIAAKTVRTDGAGRASFVVGRSGDWLVTLVHMEAEPEAKPDAKIDWRSYWASLSFSLQ